MSKMTWFKFDHDFIRDIRIKRFSLPERWAFICLLCLASDSKQSGIIEGDDEDIAFECGYESSDKYFEWEDFKEKLVKKRFITILGNGNISINQWDEKFKATEYKTSRRNIRDWNLLRFTVFERDNYTCVYCGFKADGINGLHCDHVIPYSKGGSNDLENLVTSCPSCNMSKGNKTLEEWIYING
jgi:5-methylcytosine-specific restriction endonuclease McrA